MSDRREALERHLAACPDDAFARYGLAMELARAGEAEAALVEFERVREHHPGYVAAWQQAAQLLLALDRRSEAAVLLHGGIAAAEREGNRHAAREMEALLVECE